MKFTGERYIPGIEGFIKSEHLHRYAVALQYIENRIVLDIACGEGYGSWLLSSNAKQVIGVDIDVVSIKKAQEKYKLKNLHFQHGDVTKLRFENNTFDIIVCFETIEHVIDYNEALKEIKRVLKKDGILIMSTPNKVEYSDHRNFKNEFHYHEFYVDEYKQWIQSKFINNIFLLQKPILGSYIQNNESKAIENFEGNFSNIKTIEENQFKYIISFSSDSTLEDIPSSHFFENNIALLINFYNKKSMSYKIGNLLLFPIKLIRQWIRH